MKAYSQDALRSKLLSMFPDILRKSVSVSLDYDKNRISWLVKMTKNDKEQTVILPAADADTCMSGSYCEPFKREITDALDRLEGR